MSKNDIVPQLVGMNTGFAASRLLPQFDSLSRARFAGEGTLSSERRPRCVRRSRTVCAAPPPLWPQRGPRMYKKKAPDDQEYFANVGAVIDALRADYPLLLHEEPSLALYCENITLHSPAGLLCQGHSAYRAALWVMRTQLRMFFHARSLTVVGLYHDKEAGQVCVRWRFSGVLRVTVSGAPVCVYDGLSVYTLNEKGLIVDHALDNVMRVRRTLRPIFQTVRAAAGTPRFSGTPARVPLGSGARFSRLSRRQETAQVGKAPSLSRDN